MKEAIKLYESAAAIKTRKKREIKGKENKYGLCVVQDFIDERPRSVGYKCSCGVVKKTQLGNFRTTKSCGCLRKGCNKTHGMRNSRIYGIYSGVRTRCSNLKRADFKYYVGKGIKCEWQSFEDFYRDMGEPYRDGLTIDRLDGNKNYSKENCRWATRKEQSGNLSSNIIFNGETLEQAEIRLGGMKSLISSRIHRGWSKEKTFTTPKRVW